ncbi:hypothetical protein [Mycobacterium persicum]|uniref:hypothetical protein n=1 Tax=Mycobacterium persicum TaxID=1487726 RepID=UPI0015945875|nr:hypothetical protein [Mycobacterium persicum]
MSSGDPTGAVRSLTRATGLPESFIAGLALRDELRSLFDSQGRLRRDARETRRAATTDDSRIDPRQAALALHAKRRPQQGRPGHQAQADTLGKRWPQTREEGPSR